MLVFCVFWSMWPTSTRACTQPIDGQALGPFLANGTLAASAKVTFDCASHRDCRAYLRFSVKATTPNVPVHIEVLSTVGALSLRQHGRWMKLVPKEDGDGFRAFNFEISVPATHAVDVEILVAFEVDPFVPRCSDVGLRSRHPVLFAGKPPGRATVHVGVPRHPLAASADPDTWNAGTFVGHLHHLSEPGTYILNGGVRIGIGGALGDHKGFRMRLGYEIALPDWLVFSVTAETNFQDLVVLTPQLSILSSGGFPLMLTASAGVGMPILLGNTERVGLRAAVDIFVWMVGVALYADIYFPTPDEKTAGTAGMLLEVAL